MKSSRAMFVAIGALIALLASACVQAEFEIVFNEDGSGTSRVAVTYAASLMALGSMNYGSLEEACDELANDTDLGLDASVTVTQQESRLLDDGACRVTQISDFEAGAVVADMGVDFTEGDGTWEVVLGAGDALGDELVTDAQLGLIDDELDSLTLQIAVQLPGHPTSDHNAHRIENGQFIWEYRGKELLEISSDLRAVSAVSSDTNSNYLLIVLVVVGAVLLLGIAYVVQQRREQVADGNVAVEESTSPGEISTFAPTSDAEDEETSTDARLSPAPEEP